MLKQDKNSNTLRFKAILLSSLDTADRPRPRPNALVAAYAGAGFIIFGRGRLQMFKVAKEVAVEGHVGRLDWLSALPI
jgi:hypothetical protein